MPLHRAQAARPGGRLGLMLALLAGGVVCGGGCDAAAPPQAPAGNADPAGAPPRRIVSLAPSVTELVFAVGAGDRLAGVTSYCDFPAAAQALPKVGDYTSPSVEVILSLAPDLVIVPREGSLLGPVEGLRRHGIRVEPIDVETLADLYAACERVGVLVGRPQAGARLARDLEARADDVTARTQGRQRPHALLVVDHGPTVAAGPGTFADALLAAAGAANALGHARTAWPQLDLEALAALNPEVVIDTSMAYAPLGERRRETERFWSRLPAVRAVRTGRIITIEPDLLIRPGPRLIDGLEALARALHPEAFASEPPSEPGAPGELPADAPRHEPGER